MVWNKIRGSERFFPDATREDLELFKEFATVCENIIQKRDSNFLEYIICVILNEKWSEEDKEDGIKRSRNIPDYVLNSFEGFKTSWMDHFSSEQRTNEESIDLIWEPYGLSKNQLKSLIEYADAYDLDININSRSLWFPGASLKVMVTGVTKAKLKKRNKTQNG